MARSNFINGSVTVIYGQGSTVINELRPALQSNLSQLKNNMTGSLQSLDTFPPDEILAIGGVYGMTLEDLNMQEIRSKYITAMKESSEKDSRAKFNFAPHITQEFMELGGRYIAHTDSAGREDFSAELVLALASMKPTVDGMAGTFGWLDFVNPSFKVVKNFPDSYDNDESLPQCMLAKSMTDLDEERFLEPYGFEDLIHWFEGSSQNIPNGPEWLAGLKRLVWEEIKHVMFSDPNDFLAEDVPTEDFIQALDNRATELSKMLRYKKIRGSIEGMIEAISRFKREIEDNGGFDQERVPSMLAD
jgi:hypothetical protein